jgi:invasion protein IalB
LQGKVNSNMANSFLHSGMGARIARAGALAMTVALGGAVLLDAGSPNQASAQAKKADPKAAAPAAAAPESSWVKLCDTRQPKDKDKDGKEVTRNVTECVTLAEHIHPENGVVLVSARLYQLKVDKDEKQQFEVTVPLGAALPYGAAVTMLPNDLWDKVVKNQKLEKADQDKLKDASIKLTYSTCFPQGCTAVAEATPELINKLKTSAGFVLETVQLPVGPVGQRVSLKGFPQALGGQPTDTKKFAAAKQDLMKGIYDRRVQMMEEMKKQQQDLSKMQPNVGGAAPAKK